MKFLWVLILFVSCGTEVGNPILDLANGEGNDTPSDDAGLVSKAFDIRNEICSKLVSCYSASMTKSGCMNAISGVDGFDVELGLSASQYNSYAEIEEAEANNSINANQTYFDQCIDDIGALSCSDSEVINAFSSSSPSDFSSTYEIIPTGAGSCNDVYI